MVVNNSLQSLYVDIQGSTEGAKPGGSATDRIITIRNQGDRLAEVEVWIEPSDMRAEPLRQWSTFDKSDSELKLQPQQSVDVVLSFLVPIQAEPGFYSYDLRVRSPQYQGEEVRRSQQLQVLVSEQNALRTEPRITVAPTTDSSHPYQLLSGAELTLIITVENVSRRTDRVFITCPDLPSHWFTVIYPERQGDGSALVGQTDGLQLNPKETGQIHLNIHPPSYTPAGDYFPTIRLTSSNRSDLVLLEAVYFTIPVDDRLLAELLPASRKLPAQEETFNLHLSNPGNIERPIAVAATDPERTFNYHIQPEAFLLAPGETADATVQPYPRQWWRQLWRLREQTIEFDLDLRNRLPSVAPGTPDSPQDQPAVDANLLALPPTLPSGKIIWHAKRRWLFWLVFITAGLGAVTTVALLLWYFLAWRPSFRPLITEFSPNREDYREGDGLPITFDWQVTNPDRIGQLYLLDSQQNASNIYFFDQVPKETPIPPGLTDVCALEEIPKPNSIVGNLLSLNRRLVGRPASTQVLTCTNVPLEDFELKEGSYDFQLQVFRSSGGQASPAVSDRKKVENIAIAPPAPPEIEAFSATATTYRIVTPETLPGSATSSEDTADIDANAAEASPEAPSVDGASSRAASAAAVDPGELQLGEARPLAPIQLNWTISNLADIDALKLVSLAPDGSENVPAQTYDFTDGIPASLGSFCQATDNVLNCRRVPTGAAQVGDYVFYLTVEPKRDQGQGEIVKSTAKIPIKPPMPEIVRFALNGEEGQRRPKQVFVVNPARGALDVVFTWQVRHATQVELLPAPGVIQGTSITYTVSAAPGSETVTLRALNELGEEVTQSIVIEKATFDPSQPVSPAAASAEAGGVLPPPPTAIPVPTIPIPIRQLPPAEAPPRAN